MATVREVLTEWGFKVNVKDLNKAEEHFSKLQSSITTIAVMGIGAAASLFGLAYSVAVTGDNARKTAQSIGLSVESLQEYQYAAGLSGVENEALNMSFIKISKTMSDAKDGMSTAVSTFNKLKIKVTDSNNALRPADEIISQVADRFATMKDGTEKTALAMELFGRSGSKLIPLLNSGSKGISELKAEARDLGFVMSEEDAKGAEEFKDNLERLEAVGRGLRILVGKELIPVISDLAVKFRKWILLNKELIKTRIESVIKGLAQFIDVLAVAVGKVFNVLSAFIDLLGGVERAAKILIGVLVFITSVNMITNLGLLTESLIKIGKSFKYMADGALAARLAAFKLGATILGVFLIVEDIIAGFKGKESFFGDLIGLDKIKQVKDFISFIDDKIASFSLKGLTGQLPIGNTAASLMLFPKIIKGLFSSTPANAPAGSNTQNTASNKIAINVAVNPAGDASGTSIATDVASKVKEVIQDQIINFAKLVF